MITVPITQPIHVSVLRPITSIGRGASYPASLALLWRDTSNAKSLRYITFNGKYLVVKNV